MFDCKGSDCQPSATAPGRSSVPSYSRWEFVPATEVERPPALGIDDCHYGKELEAKDEENYWPSLADNVGHAQRRQPGMRGGVINDRLFTGEDTAVLCDSVIAAGSTGVVGAIHRVPILDRVVPGPEFFCDDSHALLTVL
jgi:hypothetical protein